MYVMTQFSKNPRANSMTNFASTKFQKKKKKTLSNSKGMKPPLSLPGCYL